MKNLTRKQLYSRRTTALVAGAGGWAAAGMLYFGGHPEEPTPVYVSPQVEESVPEEERPHALTGTPFDGVHGVLAEMRDTPGFRAAQVGFCLLDASGETLVADGADTALVPASTLKTATVATALEVLGPEFRFVTRLLATSAAPDGKIDGDLVLAGGGDPTLSRGHLTTFAANLARRGVVRVTGRVIADARHFGPEAGAPVSDHWGWGDIGNAYGASPFGLNLDHNRFTAYFDPGSEVGAPAALGRTDPSVPGVAFANAVTTGAAGSGDGVVIYSAPFARRIDLRGTVPLGEPAFPVGGAVPDPPLAAAIALRDALGRAGIAVAGIPTTDRLLALAGETPPPARVELDRLESAPLTDIARHLLAVSDNLEAECLFRSLGGADGIPPARFFRDHWTGRGVVFDGLRLEDGSGLARANRIRPSDLARLNHLALNGPAGAVFAGLFPVRAGGRVLSKSGAMSGVRGAAGFLAPGGGAPPTHAFVLLLNGFTAPASEVDAWSGRLLREALAALGE